MEIPRLTKRHRYRFVHQRKGTFEGIFLGRVKVPPDDRQDEEFLTVAMDTSEGSGSEWLRRVAKAQATVTNLRPSLLTEIEEVRSDG